MNKRRLFGLIVIVMTVAIVIQGCGGNAPTEAAKESAGQAVEETAKTNVPREYRNALRAAQNYVDLMAFSEQVLFDQLTSEYGDGYPEDAARYAVENVKADWNQEALEAAMNYLEIMPMSDKELFEQLTSEYGDKFTKEQAQYAINNLPD